MGKQSGFENCTQSEMHTRFEAGTIKVMLPQAFAPSSGAGVGKGL